MTIDWANFTPWSSLAGGALIGLAATLFILLNGRIAGISGVIGGLLRPAKGDVFWRVSFIAGLVIAPVLFQAAFEQPDIEISASTLTLIAAGLLVGVGTRYGSGCTSGHGVCGLSRRSPRSLVATAAFMASGFLTVFVIRHLLGWGVAMKLLSAFVAGLVFGLGLLLSGMADPSKVIAFLDLAGAWDPSLGFVMGGAIIVASIGFFFASKRSRAVLGDVMRMPTATRINRRLVLGSLVFGAGWGLAGYCPGPAVASLLSGRSEPLIFVIAMLAGMTLYELQTRFSGKPQ